MQKTAKIPALNIIGNPGIPGTAKYGKLGFKLGQILTKEERKGLRMSLVLSPEGRGLLVASKSGYGISQAHGRITVGIREDMLYLPKLTKVTHWDGVPIRRSVVDRFGDEQNCIILGFDLPWSERSPKDVLYEPKARMPLKPYGKRAGPTKRRRPLYTEVVEENRSKRRNEVSTRVAGELVREPKPFLVTEEFAEEIGQIVKTVNISAYPPIGTNLREAFLLTFPGGKKKYEKLDGMRFALTIDPDGTVCLISDEKGYIFTEGHISISSYSDGRRCGLPVVKAGGAEAELGGRACCSHEN